MFKKLEPYVTLITASGTLLCCVLPVLLVSLGAASTLIALFTAVPQLVWLSAHKIWVFVFAGCMLAVSGYMRWQARFAPCPIDPVLAKNCTQARRMGAWLYGLACTMYVLGFAFAFVLPKLIF
jgi:hypothetical protein